MCFIYINSAQHNVRHLRFYVLLGSYTKFSVDFCVLICHAFLSSRSEKHQNAIPKAFDIVGGPNLNIACSSLLGIAVLGFSKSYIFQSFGKVMFLAIGFGIFHAAFVLQLFSGFVSPCILQNNQKRRTVLCDTV